MSFLDLFRPTIQSATPERRAQIESAFVWLAEQFSWQPVLKPTVVPTAEFFPRSWQATQDELDDLLERLCRLMLLDPRRITVDVYSDDEDPIPSLAPVGERGARGPAGLYFNQEVEDGFLIAVAISQLDDPPSLVATLAHELGHVHLLGHKRLSADDAMHEEMTDLLTIFFGLGVFTANTAFQFSQWQQGGWQGWSARRLGYLDEPSLGYSLACYARLRSETKPTWAKHLTPGIKAYLDAALRLVHNQPTGLPELTPTA